MHNPDPKMCTKLSLLYHIGTTPSATTIYFEKDKNGAIRSATLLGIQAPYRQL
jgi:hypothetical protein